MPWRLHGLDPQVVERTAEAAERFALLMPLPAAQRLSFAFLAASSRSLLAGDPEFETSLQTARQAWSRAADLAGQVGPIAQVARVCAGLQLEQELDDRPANATAMAYSWLIEANGGPSAPYDALVEWEFDPVGRTRAPGLMWRAALGRLVAPAEQIDEYREWLTRALVIAGRPVEMAMTDRHHWQRLQCPMLPIEPELLALALTGVYLLSRHGDTSPLDASNTLAERAPTPIVLATLEVARVFLGPDFGAERFRLG